MTILGHDWRWSCIDNIVQILVAALTACAILAATIAGWASMFPTDRWYELRSVSVDLTSLQGPHLNLIIDRSINRNFAGHYITTIRKVGNTFPVCSGGTTVNYEATPPTDRVVIRSMSEWTAGAYPPCLEALNAKGPGDYALTTCVFVDHRIPFVGERKVCAGTQFTLPTRAEGLP